MWGLPAAYMTFGKKNQTLNNELSFSLNALIHQSVHLCLCASSLFSIAPQCCLFFSSCFHTRKKKTLNHGTIFLLISVVLSFRLHLHFELFNHLQCTFFSHSFCSSCLLPLSTSSPSFYHLFTFSISFNSPFTHPLHRPGFSLRAFCSSFTSDPFQAADSCLLPETLTIREE